MKANRGYFNDYRIIMKDGECQLPAEWEHQSAVWFAWPVRDNLWPGYLSSVRKSLVDLYKICAKYQKVHILCPHHHQGNLIEELTLYLEERSILLFDFETNDIWIRDFGPIFLKDRNKGSLVLTDWEFNAWGGKFKEYNQDNRVPKWISDCIRKDLNSEYKHYSNILEGGAIETDGQGLICTTRSVLDNPNRFLKSEGACWDTILEDEFNAKAVFWFESGLAGDDTDGHIDNLLRFTPHQTILYAATENKENKSYRSLKSLELQLKEYTREGLQAYSLKALPLPNPIFLRGQILAASYTNYLVLNGAVIVPTFEQPNDQIALSIIGECFPQREVIGFNCLDIIREGGALHCLSLNQPAIG